jgi:tetratricopeptide (TPR) repeat protein/predicted Ser/Thr protein kinase
MSEPEQSSLDGEDPKTEADPSALTVHEADGPMPHLPGTELLRRGQTIGRYVVVEKLGAGSMGVVYRAYDPDLDRGIALKLVEIRARRGKRAQEIKARLLREAQAIARVQHPNVVQVFDVGGFEDGIFVAMEFVDGMTLKKWMRAKERPWREVLDVFLQAGAGLSAAHKADIIHRDFKPDNVMIGDPLRVRVLDFGLARASVGYSSEHVEDDDEPMMLPRLGSTSSLVQIDQSLTTEGTVVGTPAYMSPEQHVGGRVSAASDQFSFCIAMWEALYGERPFVGENRAALATAMHAGRIRAPASTRSVPRWLHQALLRGLSIEARERHPSMDALLEAIGRDPALKWRRIAIGSGAIAVVATTVLAARAASEASDDGLCLGAEEKLDAVWNEARRERIASAFGESSLPFATDSWDKASTALDTFATRWIEVRTEACRATRVHGEQSDELMDLRIGCLDRRLGDLDALLGVLEVADMHAVIGAVDGARRLGDLSTCSDVEALTSAMPPPADPAQREELDELWQLLADASALASTGNYKGMDARLDELEPRVMTLAHPPLTDQFLHLRATEQEVTGEMKDARHNYEAAFREALVAGDPRRAAYLAGKLTFIVGHRLADAETGQFWADTAHALLRHADDTHGITRASVWSAESSMAIAAGQYPRALELNERVKAFWEKHDPSDPELAQAMGNLSVVHQQLGDIDTAVDDARRSLELFEAAYGEQHPETGAASRRVAMTLTYANRHEEALALLERSLTIARSTYGDGTEVALVLDGLGRALRKLDRLEEAEGKHLEAYEIWLREYGENHPDVAVALMNIGYTQNAAGKHAAALEAFKRADAAYIASVGRDHPSRLYVASAIAQVLLRDEATIPEGNALLEEALALQAAKSVDPTLVAELEFMLAQGLTRTAAPASAERTRAGELARRALTAYREQAKHWGPQIAEIEAWLTKQGLFSPTAP